MYYLYILKYFHLYAFCYSVSFVCSFIQSLNDYNWYSLCSTCIYSPAWASCPCSWQFLSQSGVYFLCDLAGLWLALTYRMLTPLLVTRRLGSLRNQWPQHFSLGRPQGHYVKIRSTFFSPIWRRAQRALRQSSLIGTRPPVKHSPAQHHLGRPPCPHPSPAKCIEQRIVWYFKPLGLGSLQCCSRVTCINKQKHDNMKHKVTKSISRDRKSNL